MITPTDAEALERLRGRAARCAAALSYWSEGRLPPEVVPALCRELEDMADAIGATAVATVATMLRRALGG